MSDAISVAVPELPRKPLGRPAYGSIPHLPSSRRGPGEWGANEGMARICCVRPRDGDRVIVTEKLDGACVSVANIDGAIVALIRAGYRARHARHEHLWMFDAWVEDQHAAFAALLAPGERVCGEWMLQAHGTRYDATFDCFAPFIVFDMFHGPVHRLLRDEFVERTASFALPSAALVHDGAAACSIEAAMALLGSHGCHGAIDPPEGAVWRVEREGRVDFLAKWVRPDKVDGAFLPEVSGGAPLWHYPVGVGA